MGAKMAVSEAIKYALQGYHLILGNDQLPPFIQI